MNNIHNFEYTIINNDVAVIELPQFIVSGEEAMNFTQLLNLLVGNKVKVIVVDLTKVELMNSTGLGMLAGSHSNLTKINVPFYIINSNDKINQLLEMTHLDKVFKLNSSIGEILSKYSN
ncbi:MAG TPA: STAS domain-containing protein [Candidatus Kapabacteria bacterium]|nr:STAS domain-containing protein [Candidatus Kapabacteria bacterium]